MFFANLFCRLYLRLRCLGTAAALFLVTATGAWAEKPEASIPKDTVELRYALAICDPADQKPQALEDACNTLRQSVVDGAAATQVHSQAALTANADQTTILFWMTIVIVALGVGAAMIHFARAIWGREAGGIDVTVEKDGVRFKTSLVGVAILVASMIFYIAFLHFVYPVDLVG